MFEWTVSLSFSSGGGAGCGGWEDEDCYIQNRNFCSNLRPDKYKVVPGQVPSSVNFVLQTVVLSAI